MLAPETQGSIPLCSFGSLYYGYYREIMEFDKLIIFKKKEKIFTFYQRSNLSFKLC